MAPNDRPPISYRAVFADLLVRLVEACREVYGGRLVSLAVFGSVARDRPRPDSDIDLLLVVDSLPSAGIAQTKEFAAVEARMEPWLERARREGVDTRLSPIVRSAAEAETAGLPFIDMALEARILFDRNRFLADAVERLRQGLAGSKRGLATMTQRDMALSYLTKAKVRLEALDFYLSRGAYSDVVREAQEAVEIALQGILWNIGVEPPKIHDVGSLILEYRGELPVEVGGLAEELARISKWLRKEREFALYGAVDLVPSAEYGPERAEQAIVDARQAIRAAILCIEP